MERQETTMGGNPVTLVGKKLQEGDRAPDFTLVDKELAEKKLSDYSGKIKLLSVVPSLDTGVCSLQTKRFNEEAASFDDNVVILTISMDLPFAQKRWCGAEGVDKVVTLSDHRDASFGESYGVLIKELRLLNRSIFLVDALDKIIYVEYVAENTDHPDYDTALAALKNL